MDKTRQTTNLPAQAQPGRASSLHALQTTIQAAGERAVERTRAGVAEARRLGPQATALVILRWLWLGARLALIPLVAGLLGSLAAVITMGILRLAWGSPTLPELLGERLLPLMTADQFVSLLVRYAPNSKTTPLLMALEGQFAIGVLLGPLYALVAQTPLRMRGWLPIRREWIVAGAFVVALEIVTLAIFWPVLFGNLLGDPVDRARLINSIATLVIFLVFLGVIVLANRWLRLAWGAYLADPKLRNRPAAGEQTGDLPPDPFPARAGERRTTQAGAMTVAGTMLTEPISRRAAAGVAIGAAGAVIVGVGAGYVAINDLIGSYLARSNLSYEGRQTGYMVSQATQLTPNQDFYVVSKNLLDPYVDVSHWQLEIAGLVKQPHIWTYDQVRALPHETRAVTFECISNGPGGRLMSTAEWTGMTLQSVIAAAGGATADAKYVIFSCVDGYTSSLPLAALLEARAMLAYGMNGARLPDQHGYPLRVVASGRYGEQSPKWLTRIELSNYHYKGFYQSQGWSDRQVTTTSRIESPIRMQRVKLGPQTVHGLAFAGIRGIKRVEVSADDGQTWSTATLKTPLSDQTWVYWTWQWTPTTPGAYMLVVRATDGTGEAQTPVLTSTVPNGSTGQQHVPVQVVS
ncbi:MAG: molybdopterin-dependent oxidoreductase [Ktedonobacterales bacterium]